MGFGHGSKFLFCHDNPLELFFSFHQALVLQASLALELPMQPLFTHEYVSLYLCLLLKKKKKLGCISVCLISRNLYLDSALLWFFGLEFNESAV